jgi:hypothetical protein
MCAREKRKKAILQNIIKNNDVGGVNIWVLICKDVNRKNQQNEIDIGNNKKRKSAERIHERTRKMKGRKD